MACGDRPLKTSGDGARGSSRLWHLLQAASNNAAPRDAAAGD
jgi:hypothetical protein